MIIIFKYLNNLDNYSNSAITSFRMKIKYLLGKNICKMELLSNFIH